MFYKPLLLHNEIEFYFELSEFYEFSNCYKIKSRYFTAVILIPHKLGFKRFMIALYFIVSYFVYGLKTFSWNFLSFLHTYIPLSVVYKIVAILFLILINTTIFL